MRRLIFLAVLVGVLMLATSASGTVSDLSAARDFPAGPTKDPSVQFTFSATADPGPLSFVCWVDADAPESCTSPYTANLAADGSEDGSHTFNVRATDEGDATSSTADVTWTLDTIEPGTSIADHPAASTPSTSASFTYSSSESPVSFECKLDDGNFNSCPASGRDYPGPLAEGAHEFQVRATDEAGNTDSSPASFSWTVEDTTPPNTTITNEPPSRTKNTTATFDYESSESGSTFECSFNGAPFTSCAASGFSQPGLADGGYTFQVRATDDAGNTDGTPANANWEVDTTGPQILISGAPSSPSNDATPTFEFGTEEGATYECTIDPGPGATTEPCNLGTYTPSTPLTTQGTHVFEVVGTDDLGNVATKTKQWTFDSTPGTKMRNVSVSAGDGVVRISWSYPRKIRKVVIKRYPRWANSGTRTLSKPKKHLTDRSVKNWKRYRYVLKSRDKAGNLSAAIKVTARPTDPLVSPRDGVRIRRNHPPLFRWTSVPHANQYNLQLWMRHRKVHGKRCCKVLTVFPASSSYQLPREWRCRDKDCWHRRKIHHLVRHRTYDWYVWPFFRSKNDYGRLIGASFFKVK